MLVQSKRNHWVLSLCIVLVTICCCSSGALADPTVRDHIQRQNNPEYQANMVIWLDGAIASLLSANADLKLNRKQSPLFCLPPKKGLNSAEAMKLINKEIARRRWKDFVPLSTVLLDALQQSYPCR